MTSPPPAPPLRPRFWETVPLAQMTSAEWEALCDGCGKCCLNKIEYEDTGEIVQTRVACRLLDIKACRCADYRNRRAVVPDCVHLSAGILDQVAHWMPASCAYLLLHRGQRLREWHPLISGRAESVHEAGISVRDLAVSEVVVDEDDWEDYLIEEGP